MSTIDKALQNEKSALLYGNRLLLPFVCDVLKVVIDNHIITDFSPRTKGAIYNKNEYYTEIYFYDYDEVKDKISTYEVIKAIVVEEGKDVFNIDHHRALSFNPKENHVVEMEELDEDSLFID